MNSSTRIVVLGISAFLAFSIGLNLGLMGFFHQNSSVIMNENSLNDKEFKSNIIEISKDSEISSSSPSSVSSPSITSSITSSQVVQTFPPTATPTTLPPRPPPPFPAKITGPIQQFISNHGQFPIAILTCDRVALLEKSLQSLMQVHDLPAASEILVFQDGNHEGIVKTVEKYKLKLIQNIPKNNHLRGQIDGAARIANHYRFALSKVFELRPDAPGVIIVEDDLLYSPDFYQYFLSVSPILDEDPSVFLISAWNDNGFKGLVADPFELRRTDYFPGLGWLLPRKLWKEELEGNWPNSHWDHWLRSPEINRRREIVYPQIPRTYHNGVQGTFMNQDTHNRYFQNIAFNQDPSIAWPIVPTTHPVYPSVLSSKYEERIHQLLTNCKHITTPEELITSSTSSSLSLFCIWIDVEPAPDYGHPPFETISSVFGIWHEHRRGCHRGLHEFYWSPPSVKSDKPTHYILLLNTREINERFDSTYKKFKPPQIKPIQPLAFRSLMNGK